MVSGSVGTLKAVTLNRIGLKYRTSRRGSTRESSMTRRLLFVVSAGLVFIALLAVRGPTTPQMTNAEWIASFPGTPDQKKFLYGCVGCHTLERVAKSKHDAAAFLQVMKRMATYANNSHIERPQVRVVARDPMRDFGPDSDKQAAYLATLNQSAGAWSYELRMLPRVKGKGTRVVITEYDLPRRPLMPHDVIVDRDGVVWYS